MKYKAGKKAEAKPERNKDLIVDYQLKEEGLKEEGQYKYSTTQLTMKYEISSTRIYQILTKNGIARRNPVWLKFFLSDSKSRRGFQKLKTVPN